MQTLGVIGGLGPMATALFMKMAIEMTEADSDQEHIEMIVYNCPQIPDRTQYILGRSQNSPLLKMLEIGKKLKEQEVKLIAVPCVTASYFCRELEKEIGVTVIDIIRQSCIYLAERKYCRIGLMATTGTIESAIFQNLFEANGCSIIVPSSEKQQDVMHIIYNNVKANRPVEMKRFFSVVQELHMKGAEVIILGCTELSIIRQNYNIGTGYLDVMQLMAKCAVETCGTLREEYKELIT